MARELTQRKLQQLIKTSKSICTTCSFSWQNDHEIGFYDIDKKTINLNINLGLDLTNQLSLSQCWGVINKSNCLITMDSGLLHSIGTTDIVHTEASFLTQIKRFGIFHQRLLIQHI